MPITIRRSVLWPTSMPAFTAVARKAIEVLGKARLAKRQPRRARAQIVLQQFDLAGQRRRDREAAMADDLRGDALAHLAFGLRIDRQREIGMRLDVDEARRDGEARRHR